VTFKAEAEAIEAKAKMTTAFEDRFNALAGNMHKTRAIRSGTWVKFEEVEAKVPKSGNSR
jgi:hypothetical protein